MNEANLPLQVNDLKREYLTIKDEIDGAIRNCVAKTNFIGGEEVQKFEEEFANEISRKYCISCANGTDALYIALKSFNLKHDDEVIVPALTWISSSETITQAGGIPVFADVEKNSWVLSLETIKECITSKTKGIVLVHLYGKFANLEEIVLYAKEKNLFVIEDCAQSHLAKTNMKIRNTSDCSTYSFFPGKNLGAYGDAGAIATDDEELANFCRMYSKHGALKKGHHIIEGVNSRLDSIQAAILRVKLKYLRGNTLKRIEIARSYNKYLKDIKEINIPELTSGFAHVYHLYVINTDKRDELKTFLESKGIKTNINYSKALPDQPCYESQNKLGNDNFKNSRYLARTCLSLPMHPNLETNEIEYIANCIRKFFEK